MTLATRPEDVYRALLEATAFGTRTIVEAFESAGVPVKELVVAGGLLKNPLLMVKAIAAGKKPQVNDTKTYDNGKKVVPSYLLNPVPVTKADVTKELVDTGYYTQDELK